MRRVFLLAIAFGALHAQGPTPSAPKPAAAEEPKSEELCAIEGKVVHALTGEPVRKANITINRVDGTPATTGYPVSYTTSSGEGGQFAMKEIEPGRYRLRVTRNGYVPENYGARGANRTGTALALEAKQTLRGIEIKLTPHAVIAGRVVDEDGEPMPFVSVRPMRWSYQRGRRQLTSSGGSTTNDLGEFRIFSLAPGRYYVGAHAAQAYAEAADRSARQEPDQSYVPTYYPGTTDPAAAAALEVTAGQLMSGLEIRLSKMRTARIRGRVQSGGSGFIGAPRVALASRDDSSANHQTTAYGTQHRFEFRGLAPGRYLLSAMAMDGRDPVSVRIPVEVTDRDLDDVVLTLGGGMKIRVEVSAAGAQHAEVHLAPMTVGLLPVEESPPMSATTTPYGRLQADGTATLANVPPDRYRVNAGPLPDGYYIQSVRMGDQDGTLDGVDIRTGSETIRVTIAPGAAQVAGTVADAKDRPVSGATVVLLPEWESLRNWRYTKQTTTDQHGRYTFKGVDPGEYRVYAWEEVEQWAWLDADFLKPVESKGKKLKLAQHANETADVKAIPVE